MGQQRILIPVILALGFNRRVRLPLCSTRLAGVRRVPLFPPPVAASDALPFLPTLPFPPPSLPAASFLFASVSSAPLAPSDSWSPCVSCPSHLLPPAKGCLVL